MNPSGKVSGSVGMKASEDYSLLSIGWRQGFFSEFWER